MAMTEADDTPAEAPIVTPAISVTDLVKTFGEVRAVRGINFEVATGEVFGFLGPNGAGKSTTINMLCTLTKPSAGSARVAGHDVLTERDDVRRHIGLVFQDPTLDNYLTAAQNLQLHAELYGVASDLVKPRMQQVMAMVGLWDRKDGTVGTFSGGMRRRLEIARGLMHSPRVLFLDEPTIGLDPQTRRSIWNYIQELQEREEITIFMTTHYMDEAEWCDRIAIMDHGEIVALDTPAALKAGVGTDRVTIHTDDNQAAIDALARQFGLEAQVSGGRGRVRRRGRRGVRAAAVRRVRAPDHLGGGQPADARRRLYVLHGDDDPRRRGGRGPCPQPDRRADDARGPPMSAIREPVGTAPATPPEVVRVTVPKRSTRSELRAIKIVWKRELIRYFSDRLRIVTALVQPLLFLFVLGAGLQQLSAASTDGVDYKTIIYPRNPGDLGAVHGDVLGRFDRLGSGVRIPARDDGRARPPQFDRDRQVPRRCHRRRYPGRDRPVPGRRRATFPTTP